MTREEKLNKATALIQEFNPSVAEVKEGCKVKFESGKIGLLTMILDDIKGSPLYGISGGFYLRKDFVVCSEIHLEDVLKVCFEVKKDVIFRMTGDVEYKLGGYELHSWYNYDKPFTEQSEEFYEFIIKILED